MIYRILFVVCFFVTGIIAYAQHNNNLQLHGKLFDNTAQQPIMYATILNYTQQTANLSDTTGTFKINAALGDTLVIQIIGYLAKKVIVNREMLENGIEIAMVTRKFEINEAKVYYFKSYEAFQEAFMELELPETELDILRRNLKFDAAIAGRQAEYDRNAAQKLASPGFGIGIPSGQDIERAKLKKIKKNEARRAVIERKYNRNMVHELTAYTGDDLTDFIIYCNFPDDFLYNADISEITLKILEKFKQFERLKEGGCLISDIEFDLNRA